MFAQATRGGDNAAGEAEHNDYNDSDSDNDQSIYQEHVYNERDILRGCRHMFISR